MTIGFLVGAVLAIIFGVLAWRYSVVKKDAGRNPTKEYKSKMSRILIFILLITLTFVCVPFSFQTVQAGEVAVVKQLGKIVDIRMPGTYFDLWLVRTYDFYDAKVQELNMRSQAYTSDSQTMDIELTVQFQIQTSRTEEIASNYGALDKLASRIEKVSLEKTKAILSSYKAETLIANRANISPEVAEAIFEVISDKYYVTINTAVLTDISFSDAFETAVEAKMTAEQNKLQAQYENEKKIQAAEAELEVAKAQAQAKIAEAEGLASAQLAIAEAESKAIALKSVEIARMMGFAIDENTNASGAVTYTINFEGKTPQEISAISSYLQYLEYLAIWDGKLPTTLVTDDGASIMINP